MFFLTPKNCQRNAQHIDKYNAPAINQFNRFNYVNHFFVLLFLSYFLIGCGGSSQQSAVEDLPSNNAPIAIAGGDQSVLLGSIVLLNASASSDADGDSLSYLWTLESPNGSHAVLSDPSIVNPEFTVDVEGDYQLTLVVNDGIQDSETDQLTVHALTELPINVYTYSIVETAQSSCYHSSTGSAINCEGLGYDADHTGNQASYQLSDDSKIVIDLVTALQWQQSSDVNGDGIVNYDDKLYQSDAVNYCDALNLSGQTNWRLPSIKELYSLIMFFGVDPSGYTGDDTSELQPFLDPIFDYAFGDLSHPDSNDRIIDAQYATSTLYLSTTMNNEETMFGVNFVDGRIKGYPRLNKKFYVRCVSENTQYGINQFIDNLDATISDLATGLMWQQNDAEPTDWDAAIAYCGSDNTAGFDDWRLPNAKELQSIVDYSRSPDTHSTAAIDPIFNASSFTNEGGWMDWGSYWSSTSHTDFSGNGSNAVNVSFGESLGYMNGDVLDVHGAGAQRSDDKQNVTTEPGANSANVGYGIFYYKGPQGDILRHQNKVRCVRDLTN